MLSRNSINGSVEWLDVPDFMRNNGPPWTLNLLTPYASWEDRGSITIPNWGGKSVGVPTVFLSHGIVPSMSFQFTNGGSLKTCAAMCAASVTIYFGRIVRTECKVPPLSATPPAVV